MIWMILVALICVSFIAYHIGRHHGFEEGREHELDRQAKRTQQQARHRI